MGIFYLQHFDGEEYYACSSCETHIAKPDDIVSKVSKLRVDQSTFDFCLTLLTEIPCCLAAAISWAVWASIPLP